MNQIDTDTGKAAIGQRLRLTRQALGLKSTEFAARAGISRTGYVQYESGDNRPSIDNAISLCETYNLTLDWIYRGDLGGMPYQLAAAIRALTVARAT